MVAVKKSDAIPMPPGALECPETLFDFLAGRAMSTAPCVVEDIETISWAEMAKRSRAMAAGLAGLGVGAGDRVAIWLPNRSAWLVSFFACAQLGAIAVSINTRFRRGRSAICCFARRARC